MDADLVFDVSAMYQLMQQNVKLVGVSYPYKVEGETYPMHLVNERDGTPHVENGLIETEFVPTGLMRINRDVFDKMKVSYSETKMKNGIYHFFDTGDLFHDSTWYGEDIVFCKRWRKIGGRVWILPDIDIAHIGSKEFMGNFHQYMLRQPQPVG